MTKSHERGENDVTRAAKVWALRTNTNVCTVLERWLVQAKKVGDGTRVSSIVKAQKYLGCRNRRKRRKRT